MTEPDRTPPGVFEREAAQADASRSGEAGSAGSTTPSPAWREIWERRRPDPGSGSLLGRLLAADGFDSRQARIGEEEWTTHFRGWADRLGLEAGMSVFEVGCGAGASLLVYEHMGCTVGGLDQSPTLIEMARSAMPGGSFEVADAASTPETPTVDVVLSMGVFMYFPSLDYAADVLARMVGKARRAVAVLDIPDQALKDRALEYRIEMAGGQAEYEDRYTGLDHLYFDRAWTEELLTRAGLVGVSSSSQDLPGYGNAAFRFNCWGFKG